ncbi:MAG: hypothetical protein DMF17_11135, partial [Verrucomicrobia bacterium]
MQVDGPVWCQRSAPRGGEQGVEISSIIVVSEAIQARDGCTLRHVRLARGLPVELRDAQKHHVIRVLAERESTRVDGDLLIAEVVIVNRTSRVQQSAGHGTRPSGNVRARDDVSRCSRGSHVEREAYKVVIGIVRRREEFAVRGGVGISVRIPVIAISGEVVVDGVGQAADRKQQNSNQYGQTTANAWNKSSIVWVHSSPFYKLVPSVLINSGENVKLFFVGWINEPVKFVVLFGLPKNQLQTHLGTRASIPKFLNDRSVRADLVKADSAEQILSIFRVG